MEDFKVFNLFDILKRKVIIVFEKERLDHDCFILELTCDNDKDEERYSCRVSIQIGKSCYHQFFMNNLQEGEDFLKQLKAININGYFVKTNDIRYRQEECFILKNSAFYNVVNDLIKLIFDETKKVVYFKEVVYEDDKQNE